MAPTAGLEPVTCNLVRLLRLISAAASEIVESKQFDQSEQAILLMELLSSKLPETLDSLPDNIPDLGADSPSNNGGCGR